MPILKWLVLITVAFLVGIEIEFMFGWTSPVAAVFIGFCCGVVVIVLSLFIGGKADN